MPRQKPTVFLGSSREAESVAKAFIKPLSDYAHVSPWWISDSFKPSESTLEGLLLAARKYDFGIFILAPDDKTTSRGKSFFSTRDNALFEFGLFLGSLSAKRAWATTAIPSGRRVRPASDLLGITIPAFSYSSEDELKSAVQSTAIDFGDAMKKLGPRNFNLVGGWDFDHSKVEFSIMLDPDRMTNHADRIHEKEMLLVYRKENPDEFRDADTMIVMSSPRRVNASKEKNVMLRAAPRKDAAVQPKIEVGDKLLGYLFILPATYNLKKCTTIGDLLDAGCILLDRDFAMTVKKGD